MKEIESWAQRGVPQKEIAGKLGISYTTFRKYIKKDEKLESLLKQGKIRARRKVERALATRDAKPRPRTAPKPTEIPLKNTGGKRPDQNGTHRKQFERNKKKIYATQSICAICGKPVDYSIPYPHPLSACIDHIIPVSKGGHPSDINNMQLAHMTCNRQKSDKLIDDGRNRINTNVHEVISNRVLPHTLDWRKFNE
ncbi:MAG: HNH endonuclease [Oliverpabstia sp.]|nr:HNH endonuclease [Oliverpabstia sp.]